MSGQGTTAPPLYGLLLSGGASRRMQRDKAHVEYRGEPQLLRAWRLLGEVTERAFVSAREDQAGDPLRAGLPLIVDSYNSIGPAAGVLSAQDAYPEVAWLVLACDLPLLDLGTLRTLLAERDPAADATAFTSRHDGLPEPLCAIWEPASHVLLLQRYQAAEYCPRKALIRSNTRLLPPPGEALDNINTPADLEQMQSAQGVRT
jgi:molybdopterin-guanine dinucleotide biosynthesis protein A